MLSPEQSRLSLRRLFRQRRIADLALLSQTLQTDAPRSVFRRLAPLGYLSSYSHNSRYYTLDDIPDFDDDGLWQYQGVSFSRHRTLKATTVYLVDKALAGCSYKELELRLRVRVHNVLLDQVKSGHIGRELIDGLFLYVSADGQRAAAQVNERHRQECVVLPQSLAAGRPLVIEVLLEVIHGTRIVPDPALVAERLVGRGVLVSREQVEGIFHAHGLKKTSGSRSRSSRR
mgnify:CR=1 FL=1